MDVLLAYMSGHYMTCVKPVEARRGNCIPVPGSTDDHKLSCRCWELNLGHLEEQTLLIITQLSLQPLDGEL